MVTIAGVKHSILDFPTPKLPGESQNIWWFPPLACLFFLKVQSHWLKKEKSLLV